MMRASTALMSGWRKGPGISPTRKSIGELRAAIRDARHKAGGFARMPLKCLQQEANVLR